MFNQYYHEVTILKEEDIVVRSQRLVLIDSIAKVLSKAMGILGITCLRGCKMIINEQ